MPPHKSKTKPARRKRNPRGRGSVEHHLLLLLLGFRAEDLLDGAEPLALLPHGATPRSSKQSPWHLERSKQVTNQTTYLETTGVKPRTTLSEEETPKSSCGSKGKEGGRLETGVSVVRRQRRARGRRRQRRGRTAELRGNPQCNHAAWEAAGGARSGEPGTARAAGTGQPRPTIFGRS